MISALCLRRDLTALNSRYNKPVMLTEFACGDAADQQLSYMQGMLSWMNSQSFMVGYAWCVTCACCLCWGCENVCWDGFSAW